jgi:MFS family permease
LSTPPTRPSRRISWVYATLPINTALGPIGVFVQLYLLQLNGIEAGTVYIAVAVTAFNAVSIPAAVIWGVVTDRLHKRKVIIVSSYLLTAVFLISFFFTNNTTGVIIVYSLVSFISSATATPLDLLIMESEQKNKWATGFAKLSLVSSIGNTLGYVISSVWVQFLPARWLVVPLGVLSLVSVMMAVVLIQEPPYVFEREVVVRQKPLTHRLMSFPLIFLKFPGLYEFRSVFKGLRNELTSYVPMLYISLILFYLGSGIYNTSLVPSLTAHSLSGSDVYAIIVVASIAQILAFRFAGQYITGDRSLPRIATQSVILRGSCYALLGVASIAFPGMLFLIPSLVLYTLAAGIGYGIYYTASNTMVFNSIGGRNHGSSLGVYSAVVGISSTVGSLLSGVTSHYFGFAVTFVIAGGILGASSLFTLRLARNHIQPPST